MNTNITLYPQVELDYRREQMRRGRRPLSRRFTRRLAGHTATAETDLAP